MKVEMRDLREGPVDLKVDCSPAALELSDPEFRFDSQVTGQVQYQLVGDKVMSRGSVSTFAGTECVRCLQPIQVPLQGNVEVFYENDDELKKPENVVFGSGDDPLVYFDGMEIRPEPELREAIMVELPSLPVCSEDCKGLCPKCGQNLNEGPCDCTRDDEEANPLRAALKNIKLDS